MMYKMEDQVTIRRAVKEDEGEWARLKQQIHTIHVQKDSTRFASMDDAEIHKQFAQLLQEEAAQIWGAFIQGRMAGYMVIQEKASQPPYHLPYRFLLIDEICVDETCRRHGIGRALIEHAREIAASQNMKEVVLTVWNFNKEAVAFYQAIGMRTELLRMSLPVCRE